MMARDACATDFSRAFYQKRLIRDERSESREDKNKTKK